MPDQPKKEFWLICQVCKGKTRTRVQEDTVLVNFPLFCPKMQGRDQSDLRQSEHGLVRGAVGYFPPALFRSIQATSLSLGTSILEPIFSVGKPLSFTSS